MTFAPHNLSQNINPWTWWNKATDNITGFINITNYKTTSAEVENKIVSDVAGYGMQLDAIEELLEVIIDTIPNDKFTTAQKKSVSNFRQILSKIKVAKENLVLEKTSDMSIDEFIYNLESLKKQNLELYKKTVKRIKDAL